jgi:hypothetical protein
MVAAMPWLAFVLAILALPPWTGAGGLPDPCYDPDRPWPVYCEPMEDGRIERAGRAARYQLYAFYEDLAGDQRPPQWVFDLERPYRLSGLRLFDDAGVPLLQIEYNVGTAWIDALEMVESPAGVLLVVRVGHAGSGAILDYRAFRAEGAAWRALRVSPWGEDAPEAKGWADDLATRLPEGHAVWKGILVDFATMTSTTSLWRPEDPNCCPTGGTADLRFAIVGDALRVIDIAVRPAE